MRIEVRGLGKSYDGERWAVRDLDLNIPSGSIFGLIGPNGAGKSTTLRMLATVLEPTEGQVEHDGVSDPGELRHRIGFLGDGNPLYKDMTPAEYLRFFGQCYRMHGPDLERAIEDTLVTFQLEDKRDTLAEALSKGMRQRLLIARCMLHAPGLLILDEPGDGLDPRGRADLRSILSSVRQRGITIVISSHILRELDDLCDEVAIIQRGKAVVTGGVSDVIDRYEVGRLAYQLRIASDPEHALQALADHPVLVERTDPVDGRAAITMQLRGPEEQLADILQDLVDRGVRVLTVSREKSRLEDVYARLSEHQVN